MEIIGSGIFKGFIITVLSLSVITSRVGYYVVTPLWLDYFQTSVNLTNITVNPKLENRTVTILPLKVFDINEIFLLVGHWGFTAAITGLVLLLITIFHPSTLSEANYTFPKFKLFLIGFSQAVSSLLFNYSLSGSRTPPYLQAILGNFNIPIQFTVSYILLRKRPTLLKCLCACVVLVAELVCLIPTIFPSLETPDQKQTEGGATGAGAVLWPLCLVASQIPYAVANTLMETSVQKKKPSGGSQVADEQQVVSGGSSDNPGENTGEHSGEEPIEEQLNIFYFTFWWSFFITLTCVAFFWVDLIPGFGTSNSIEELWHEVSFSAGCSVGVSEGCGGEVIALGWLNFNIALLGALSFSALMKYSEGSNYVIIVLAFRTPLVFLFWTLFEENPFLWKPHVALSTYLSVVAIVVMIPAVIIYNTGFSRPIWCRVRRTKSTLLDIFRSRVSESAVLIEDNTTNQEGYHIINI